MANYTSHAIVCEKEYYKFKRKKLFKVDIDLDTMKLFSLGQDLTFFSRECFLDTHYNNSRIFFIETLKYIKENNLEANKEVMAYLYGHISHYALDITIHPIIGKIIEGTKSKSVIGPHTFLECEMDKYLLKKYYKNNFDYSFLKLKPINNKTMTALINMTYRKAYGFIDTIFLYRYSILILKFINKVVTYLLRKKELLNKVCRIDYYDYQTPFYKYLNCNKKLFQKDMDDIVNLSLKLTENLIKCANNFLYDNGNVDSLILAFDNTPYDVGVLKEKHINQIPAFSSLV